LAQPASRSAAVSPGRYAAALRTGRAGRALRHGGPIRRLPPPLSAWTDARDAPAPPARTFASGGVIPAGTTMAGADQARAEVLARIRAALGSGASAPAGIPRGYRAGTDQDIPALISLLTERLHDYGTSVRRCGTDGVARSVREALAGRGARRVVLPPGLSLDGAAPDGVTFLADDGLSPGLLDAADGVVTTAALAIAETGTIILDGGPGQGRRA
jgi:hypothetical protein